MLLRKINAGLSLLTTLLLVIHAMFLSVWMLARCSFEVSNEEMPYVLVGLAAIHALLSIILAIRGHKGAKKEKVKSYPKMNIPTFGSQVSQVWIVPGSMSQLSSWWGFLWCGSCQRELLACKPVTGEKTADSQGI